MMGNNREQKSSEREKSYLKAIRPLKAIKALMDINRKLEDLHKKLADLNDWPVQKIEIQISYLENLKRFLTNERFYLIKENKEAKSFVDTLSRETPDNIAEEARPLMRFLSSSTELHRTRRETPISNRVAFLKDNLPHVIFIPGNNDLNQIDDMLIVLRDLKKEFREKNGLSEKDTIEKLAAIPVIFSGKGGHGVAPGPIFVTTEAKTMSTYFKQQFELLIGKGETIPWRVFEEEQSTNSGQNVDYTKPILRDIETEMKDMEEKNYDGLRIWLVPTPVGGIRQLATVCQQAEQNTKTQQINGKETGGPGYRVNSVFMLPNEKHITAKYFSHSREDACINLRSEERRVG